jgi:predicted AlkP superfamily pyrophosphatase or phosphodiesterase
MKKNIYLFWLLLSVSNMAMAQNSITPSNNLPKKVVFIIVDGISADQLKAIETPYLDSIAREGSYTDAYVGGRAGTYSETPTISAVGYNSLLTGTWANKHNVWGNSIKEPNYNYPTIFRLYKDQYPGGRIGVYSSWLDNRTKLVGDDLPQTQNIKVNYSFDGLEHDSINFPHDTQRNFMKLIDYTVADRAAESILQNGPDLSWVYLEFTDDMGHGFGDSDRFSASVQFEDRLVGKIWKAVQKRQKIHNEDWLLIITTDHGRSLKDGKGHGGQSDRERSAWIVMNTPSTNTYFKQEVPGIVDIAPSIASFMNIEVPRNVSLEWDGVSLFDPVNVFDLQAVKEKKKLVLTWKNLDKGTGKIYISETNNFKTGGSDAYLFVKNVSLEDGRAEIPLRKISGDYAKLILETEEGSLNTWYTNN